MEAQIVQRVIRFSGLMRAIAGELVSQRDFEEKLPHCGWLSRSSYIGAAE